MLLTLLLYKNGYTGKEIRGEIAIISGQFKKKRETWVQKFKNDYLSNNTHAFYFLPKLNTTLEEPSLVNFEVTSCVRGTDLEKLKKICVLKSPFREAVPAKYAAYIGRIGTPSCNESYLSQVASSVCKLRDS